MSDALPAMPTAGGIEAQAKGAATTTVSGLEHFFTVLFDVLVPVVAAIIGLVVGPLIFTGQCIADGIWGATGNGANLSGPTVFAIGHLVGGGVVAVAASSLWTWQDGKSGLAGWVARAGAGFAIGWAVGIFIQLSIGLTTSSTGSSGNGGILDSWVDTISAKIQAGAKSAIAQAAAVPVLG